MEEIIKKAIKGGYEKERYYFDSNGNFDDEPYEVVLMKSSFWQSLGKACGWKKTIVEHFEGNKPYVMRMFKGEAWMYPYMHFHEINLTQGFDKAVEYLQELIKG